MAPPKITPSQDAKTLKTCIVCGTDFRTTPKDWERRVYCSHACKWSVEREKRRAVVAADVGDKRCAVCRIPLVRGNNEDAGNFRNRQTCGRACHIQLAAERRTKPTPKRTCEVCGSAIVRRENEKLDAFNRRKACSRKCAVAKFGPHRAHFDPKYCRECGVLLERRHDEPANKFAARKTCSKECMQRFAAKQKRHAIVPRSFPYPLSFNREFKQRIRSRDGFACVICGQGAGRRNLAVHHIDYDKQNIKPNNLVSLCSSCHQKTNFNRPYWQSLFAAMMAEREAAA